MIVLHYIGDGSYLPDVPARDLTQADVDALELDIATLTASGLYAPPTPPQEAE